MMGTRPIVELRFSDFALCAIDELVNQAAKARFMFGGQGRVPLVVREPIGMWRSSAAQHSQSLEGWYAHIPGLVVIAPATPADNKGLLKSAIRCDDPVVYMEHKNLWPLEGDIPAGDQLVEIGKARTARPGKDLTIVAWSAMVQTSLAAAESLASKGIEAEVLDLRSLWPWDKPAVLASVERTGRLIIAHEAVRVGGFGAEIAATVAETLHKRLAAPVCRLGAPRAPIAYAPGLEDQVRVTSAMIVAAAEKLHHA
jgi:pyruvate dehydrogenase E1 component beta subunit